MQVENLDSFNPQDCISGKMMRLNRVTANIFRKYLSPFGVTDSQLTILFILTKKDDLNQKQLADIIKLEKSSLNRNLKRLVISDLISRDNFPTLTITNKGQVLVHSIIPEWNKAMNEIRDLLESDGMIALETLTKKLL